MLYTQNTLELAYADDVAFISTTDFVDVETIQKELADFRLNVNTNKTEYTLLQKDGEDWKKSEESRLIVGRYRRYLKKETIIQPRPTKAVKHLDKKRQGETSNKTKPIPSTREVNTSVL
ncbi:hypothetical protein ElyMa_003708400 [Elysia marginata]|uniref:Reverse transcriptase domain-containing protein n=1 Tax=Elysia marginata TaxID=1093978 RepID=A0AAV4F418_9GAST|nr:hypothetical protein ElyMa_003708400 [Elysia marginata]